MPDFDDYPYDDSHELRQYELDQLARKLSEAPPPPQPMPEESHNSQIRTELHKCEYIDALRKSKASTMLVHFFKPSGKWYCDEEVKVLPIEYRWPGCGAMEQTLATHLKGRLKGMTWFAPINPYGYPATGRIPE